MSNTFDQGYALLIGVDEQGHESLKDRSLPAVRNDIHALKNVLINPGRCAYRDDHVSILTGKEATRENILEALEKLANDVAKDRSGNTTAIVYFSGHGYSVANNNDKSFFLIPHEANASTQRSLERTSISDETWVSYLEDIKSQRMLVILDCCHAGSSQSKEVSKPGKPRSKPADSKPIIIGEEKQLTVYEETRWDSLSFGKGRVVLRSSADTEYSYIREDNTMGVFTYHLIEALTGHANPESDETEVDVTQVINYVQRKVKEYAETVLSAQQTPTFYFDGNDFAIAKLIGGKGTKGYTLKPVESDISPRPEVPVKTNSITSHGDGSFFVQDSQGTIINIGGNAGGKSSTTGDTTNISTGDLSGNLQGVALGKDQKVEFTHIEKDKSFQTAFQLVYAQIDKWTPEDPNDPAITREELSNAAEVIKGEIGKGDQASKNKIERHLRTFKTYAPGILETIANLVEDPKLVVSEAIRGVARMMRDGQG